MKKQTRKILSIFLILAFVLAFAASCKAGNEVEKAFLEKCDDFKKTIKNYKLTDEVYSQYKELVEGQFNAMVYGYDPEMAAMSEYFLDREFFEKIIKGFQGYVSVYDVTIERSDISGDTATVTTKVKGPDLVSTVTALAADPNFITLTTSFDSGEISDEALQQVIEYMINLIEKPATKTYDATFKMSKQDGEWKILIDETVINVLAGGVLDYAALLGTDFSDYLDVLDTTPIYY